MDLFVIACTTCRQRLKVRDLALVGQIQPCPSCGGMVHLQPPPDWRPPADAPANKSPQTTPGTAPTNAAGGPVPASPAASKTPARKEAARKDEAFIPPNAVPGKPLPRPSDPSVRETAFDKDFGDIDRLLEANTQPKTPGGTSNQITASAIDGVESPPTGKRTVFINRDLDAPRDEKQTSLPLNGADDFPSPATPANGSGSGSFAGGLPGPDSTDSASGLSGSFSLGLPVPEKDTRHPWLVSGIVVATALGIALTVLLAVFAKPWLRRKPVAHNTPSVDTPVDPTPSVVPSPDNSTPAPDREPKVSPDPTENETPVESPDPPVEMPETPEDPSNTGQPADPATPPQDPLGLLDDPKTEPEKPATVDPAKADQLARLTSDSNFDDTPKMETAKAELEPEAPGETTSRARPPMREIDIKARLADKLEGIDIPDKPLSVVLSTLSDFSTIPMAIDPESLMAVGVDLNTPLQGKYTKTTLGNVLRETLAKRKLEFEIHERTLLVVASKTPRESAYNVADLAKSDDELARLALLVEKVLIDKPPESESPETEEESPAGDEKTKTVPRPAAIRIEKGKLVAVVDERTHFRVKRILDAVRVARKSSPREGIAEAATVPDGFAASCREPLAKTLKLNFSFGTSLANITQRFAQETGTTITIDWVALAEAGWSTDADASLVVNDQPLSAALDALLGPMDLTWHPVGPASIQVTTSQALSRRETIDFYSLADVAKTDDDASQWISVLSSELTGDQRQFAFDAASGLLIANVAASDHAILKTALANRKKEAGTAAE